MYTSSERKLFQEERYMMEICVKSSRFSIVGSSKVLKSIEFLLGWATR